MTPTLILKGCTGWTESVGPLLYIPKIRVYWRIRNQFKVNILRSPFWKNSILDILIMKKIVEIGEFWDVFCFFHSKYQKYSHNIIYFLKDTVKAHLKMFVIYEQLVIFLTKSEKKLFYWEPLFRVLSYLYDTMSIYSHIDIYILIALLKSFQNIYIHI